jgi:alpha-L-arabinofuranosidase
MSTVTKAEAVQLSPVTFEGPPVSELLMGANLELAHIVSEALLANRVRNGKFAGPAEPQTGVAKDWQPFGMNMGGMHARVLEGMFLSPPQCQMLHCYSGAYGAGIVQSGIPLRKGERLEFRIWAKVRHAPVRLFVSLRAEPTRNEDGYANAEILIDSSYWKCYSVELPIPVTDERAILFLLLKDTGVLLIDQVSLEPAGSSGVDMDVQEALLRLNPSAIRFPGGCMSTNYHWKLGLGPREFRQALADPVFKSRSEYGFGTDEYLELTHLMGGTPHITVNVGSGTPEDAAEWAAYCREWYVSRGITPPKAYFQIGNEQYGPWETSHMTAEMYVRAIQDFVPGIREAYPDCRIIALAEPVSTGVAGQPDTPFRQEVLKHAGGLVDVLAINRYKGQWYDDPSEQLQNAVDSVGKIRNDLEVLADEAREAGWKPRLALTEWNYWLHAAHWDGKEFYEPDDALHGVFFTGMLHTFFRMSETVEVASFYHLLNAMGLVIKKRGHVTETAIGSLYRIYRAALPAQLVTLNDSSLGVEKLDCLALTRDGSVSLFLRYWGEENEVTLNLDEAFGELSGSQTFSSEDCYSPMKNRPAQLDGRVVTLPPLSVTKIEFCR